MHVLPPASDIKAGGGGGGGGEGGTFRSIQLPSHPMMEAFLDEAAGGKERENEADSPKVRKHC